MKKEIIEKIQYLCNRISEVEWSGILLYSVKGSIKDVESLELHCEDIIPMHKGTIAATNYRYNNNREDKHIDYVSTVSEKNPEVLTWKIGHIHSHNNMNVFFSSTDMDEIEENAKSHNFYLSLIVNNKMEMTAKVAIYAKAKHKFTASYIAKDEQGKDYPIKNEEFNFIKENCSIIDCEIIRENTDINIDSLFTDNVDKIIQESKVVSSSKWSDYNSYPYSTNNYFNSNEKAEISFQKYLSKTSVQKELPFNKINNKNSNLEKKKALEYAGNTYLQNSEKTKSFNSLEEEDDDDNSISIEEQFAVYILNNGEYEEGVDAFEYLSSIETKMARGVWQWDVKDFITKYYYYFIEFFPDEQDNDEFFLEILSSVVQIFEEVEIYFDAVRPLTKALSKLLKNFKKE